MLSIEDFLIKREKIACHVNGCEVVADIFVTFFPVIPIQVFQGADQF